jgi:hypothetical protein
VTQLAMNFEAAREAGRTASEACTARAERAGLDTDGARRFVVGHLVRHGPTSGEDLVDALKAHGFRGHDDRAFGSVFSRAIERGLIVCLRSDLPRRRGHGTSGGKLYAVGDAA